ncbi:Protein N-acetyltransferase, RimJ/RimL family [Micromonospora haikouensis]|uniref:Protein N-acetyltransferase, RimJ/RimL family n=2 Tax=Micromonospora haikouensis TaxID=686309 RepID=A0A1C4YMB2_9ACTN|nr:Protein N-acetyltransferase, RimJ/RimL family [Micromonospora haikouensis]
MIPRTAKLHSMDVRLEPWSDSALDLLRLINTPPMRRHVGGPEPEEQLLARHRRYLAMPAAGRGCMFAVLTGDQMVGSIAYHQRDWQGEQIYETGWNVLPPYQCRGIASAAGTALITIVREAAHLPDAPHSLHAFPSVENAPSNALCRRLGFTLLGPCNFEYPQGSGTMMRSNDWRIDLPAVTTTQGVRPGLDRSSPTLEIRFGPWFASTGDADE